MLRIEVMALRGKQKHKFNKVKVAKVLTPEKEEQYLGYIQRYADGESVKSINNGVRIFDYALLSLRFKYDAFDVTHLVVILMRLGKIK